MESTEQAHKTQHHVPHKSQSHHSEKEYSNKYMLHWTYLRWGMIFGERNYRCLTIVTTPTEQSLLKFRNSHILIETVT